MKIDLFDFLKINNNIKKITTMLIFFFVLFFVNTVHAENATYDFSYTGNYQEFVVPYTGTYKVELWGAQGGQALENNKLVTVGAYGAYTAGMIELQKGQKLYIYVGGAGGRAYKSAYSTGGWNGGGRGDWDHSDDEAAGGGGGATDIRLTSGAWNDFASLKSRIMVAAGGAGSAPRWGSGPIGFGGSITSNATPTTAATTQTTGYAFGTGSPGTRVYANNAVSGGGGGYYGGKAVATGKDQDSQGAGGSSFISGYEGCNAIAETSTSTNIIHTGQSIHYSGLKFDYGIMVRGNGASDVNGKYDSLYLMPNPSGGNYASGTGRTGNGYARIQYLEDIKKSDYPNYNISEGYYYAYSYTGNYQTFVAPADGTYKFEAWGARGGAGSQNRTAIRGGYGGYAAGTIHLTKGETFYVYVGQAGYNYAANCSYCGGYGGWNGGAKGGNDSNRDSSPDEGGGGGGATDFRTVAGTWNAFDSLKSRILIAGGGGGGNFSGIGGAGGGINGVMGYGSKALATQTSGYSFGTGMTGGACTDGAGGGGGGYYGGNTGTTCGYGGGGGSAFVSGHSSCNAISAASTASSIVHTGQSNHYSGYVFSNPTIVDGQNSMPNWAGTGTMTGNNNNGYAKVTILELDTGHPLLSSMSIDGATIKPDFDPETYEYDIYVDSESYRITIDGEAMYENDIIFRGLDTIELASGLNKHHIGLINDLGNVTIYSLKINRPASSYQYLEDIKIDGTSIEGFNPETLTYDISLSDTTEEVDIDAVLGRPSQTVEGLGKLEVGFGTTTHEITVLSEDGSNLTTYTLNFNKSNSSKLKSLKIEDYALSPSFDPETLEYTIEISTGSLYVDVEALPFDKSANVTITGNGYLPVNKKNKIIIVVDQKNVDSTTYVINVEREGSVENEEFVYNCSSKYQTFEAPATTYYKIQAWGARGGYGRTHWALKYRGGYGAYTEGEIRLKKGEKIYLYVGCAGVNAGTASKYTGGAGGWNGGAAGGNDSNKDSQPEPGGGGGGASDIRLVPTSGASIWNEFESLKSRIMVAAGGGGGNFSGVGGGGGTLIGLKGYGNKSLPTQISGYAFGYGMAGGSCTDGAGGAGGGYFGGYTGTSCGYGGGGGSSYVSGCDGCVGITEDSTVSKITSSGISTHYSGYEFDDIVMLSGDESMPSANGGYTTGNNDNGHIIITGGRDRSSNNFLREITVDKGTLSPAFDLQTLDYDVEVGPEDDTIKIGAKLEDDTAVISGIGTFDVPAGTTSFPITVTAENGDIRTYTVNVTRKESSNQYPFDISISGLVPSLCALKDEYCILDNEFDPSIHEYEITVPSRIKQLEFTVTKGHKYQKVSGDGIVSLDGGMNFITIEVVSEDGENTASYTYKINRDMTGNASIEKLEVIDPKININFDPDLTEYYFSIPNDYTNLELEVTLEDEKASYEIIGNDNFNVGVNVVTIRVTAQNGETKDYTLNVYREQNGNIFLQSLKVTNEETEYLLNPLFNKIITTYVVNVPNEVEKVNIEAIAEHNLTTVVGTGEKSLNTGTNNFGITTTSEDGSTEIYNISIIRAKSSDATLKELNVLESMISPDFDKEVDTYELNVNPGITSLNINAIPNSDKAKVQIIGNSGFKVGSNVVKVQVTAEDGTKKIYTLNVNRLASSNNYLNYLNTDIYDMTGLFDKETLQYNIEVENDVTSINVTAIKDDVLSKLTGSGKYNLKTGNNEINITVTSEDGNSRIYTINVFRKYNSNANLFSITTNPNVILNPTFDKDNVEYKIEVENDVTSITIIGTPEVKTSKITGNGTYNLNVGENIVNLEVIAEDGTKKTYELVINRSKSNNTNATSIIARESVLDPKFDKNTTEYNLRVLEDVTSLTLTVKLESDAATYEVIGNEDFEIGNNEVIVRVIAEDGTTKDYKLNVLRQAEGTASSKLLSLDMQEKRFTPDFEANTLYYEVEVPYSISTATLVGELDDKNATVTGLGAHNLEVGENILAVQVTSTEGVIRTYQVVVTRLENDEARLSNLMVSGSSLNPIFNKDTYEYSVESTDANLSITATPIDSNAKVEIIGGNNLEVGESDVIIKVTAKDGHTVKEYTIHVKRNPSNNNNLKLLEIDGVTFTPAFSKTTTVYYAEVAREINNVQVTALPEDINATISGDGEINLEIGKNYNEIVVTSEAGTTKTYTLIITRKAKDNNYLSALVPSSGTLDPVFEKTVNSYTVTVPYETDKITLSGLVEDDDASVMGLDTYQLEVGENNLKVTVTSESGISNTYKVKVIREDIVSSLLKTLSVKNYEISPDFDSDVLNYLVTIDNEVTSLDLSYTTLDKNASVKVSGNENFKIGLNTVEIEVTDSKGLTMTTYTIDVNRQSYSNNYLSYIAVNRGELVPNFDKTNLTYDVAVANEIDSINILAEAEVESNTVTGTGTFDLKPGVNKFPIKVESPTGIIRTYYVNVTRAYKDDNYLESLQVKVNNEIQKLTPEFNKDTLTYSLNVPAGTTSILFNGTVSDGATVTGLGSKTVKLGDNQYLITVTSEAGTTKVYTINVNRPASNDNFLTDIKPSIGTLTPAFSYYGTEYNLSLDSAASLLSFEVTTSDRFAVVTGNDKQVVPDGASVRKILVTAEDGSIREYIINVNKDRTDEARLSSLSVNGYNLEETFDKDTFTYTLNVPNSKKVLLASEVIATPVDSNAKVSKTSSVTLSASSSNLYTIVVTAKDGFTKQNYYINVNREKGSEALLSSLKFNTGTLSPTFNSSLMEYTLTVPNTIYELTSSNVTAIATTDDAIVTKMNRLNVSGNGEIYEVKVTSGDGSSSNIYKVKIEYLQSNDATLKELNTSVGELEPLFNKNTYSYTVNVTDETESIDISALANDSNATIISGIGTHELNGYETKIDVAVQAEDGTIKVYTVKVVKSITLQKLIDGISLKGDCDDTLCPLSPNFDSETFNYTTTVDNEIKNIEIEYIKRHENQTVKFYNDSTGDEFDGSYELRVGENKIRIDVINGVGDKTSYNLIITRKKSSNNYLKALEITNAEVELEFSREVQEYFVTIPSDLDKVELKTEKEDSKAVVRTSGANYLEEGNNDVIISVQAENGDIREYIIHVFKGGASNFYLQSLTVSSGIIYKLTPKFNKSTFDYVVTVPSTVNTVTIDAVPEDTETIVTGVGEKNIKTGVNNFTITTTSKDGVIGSYKVIVNKQKADKLYLKSLDVSEGTLDPDFDKETMNYKINVRPDVESLTINAIPEDSDATVKIVGNKNLVSGKNNVYIILSNSDKTVTTTYTLEVNKDLDDNNFLKSLKVNDSELMSTEKRAFTEFSIDVESDVNQVNITALPESVLTKVTDTGIYSLNYGENKIKVNATSEDGNTRTYTITINRKYTNDLFMITTDRGELKPTFDKDTTDYYLDVKRDIEDINILAVAVSSEARIEGNGYHELEIGENLITVTVRSDDSSYKIYNIHVTRNKSDDNYLENLYVEEGVITPTFNKETLEYKVEVPYDINKVNVDYILSDEHSSVEIKGNENLKTGNNKVSVIVTAEDGSTRTYEITVYVQDESEYSNKLKSLTIDKGKLSPDFDPDTMSYTATVTTEVDIINLSGVLESVDAKVTGLGKHNIALGRNEIPVIVTSKDGKTRTYSVIVYRIKSSDARLKTVTFKEGVLSPLFDKDTYDYEMTVDSSVFELTEEVSPLVSGTTYKISGSKNLKIGENTIVITSTAADGESTKTYTIKVTREISTDNFLESLNSNIGTITPEFTRDSTGPYVINVDDSINSVTLSGKPSSQTSTVTGFGVHNINRGSNTIPITVTSEAGTTRTYTVIVNKALSNDNTLYLLKTSDGDLEPEFDKDTLEYTVNVSDEVNEITVLGLATSSYAKVSGNGQYTVNYGNNKIELTVTAEDGSIRVYTLNVVKTKEASSKIMSLNVHEGVISPSFDKNTLEYSITVPNEVTSLTLDVKLEDSESSYVITGNKDFKVGSNQVFIEVTDKLGGKTTYILNVIRQNASNNYLKALNTGYDLKPEFNRTTQYYEIEVDPNIDGIVVDAIAEDENATIEGNGYHELSKGTNYIYITVTSTSGVDRVYTLKITRNESSDNKLASLSVNIGPISPEFDPDVNEYTIDIPEGIDEMEITAMPRAFDAFVMGDGIVTVENGENTYEIVVTAEDGSTNIYKIIAQKAASNNTNIINIIPSSGVLSPNYTDSIESYEVTVDEDVSVIDFDVILDSSFATVSGDKNNYLDYGSNDITITVTAEDGTKKEVYINVIREKNITSISVDREELVMAIGDIETITPIISPEDVTNSDIGWETRDSSIATVENGEVEAINLGTTEIIVYSIKNPNVKKIIKVNVINLTITSEVYDVRRDELDYIIGSENGELLSEFVTKLDNSISMLHFYDLDSNEIIDLENEKVKTGQLITLEYGGKIHDQVYIAVRGEATGDGEINVKDYNTVVKHVLKKENLENYWFSVGNVDDEEALIINVKDTNRIQNKILGKINSLNTK